MIIEIQLYCKALNIKLPEGFPDKMTNEEMEKWIEVWDEFNPFPEIN